MEKRIDIEWLPHPCTSRKCMESSIGDSSLILYQTEDGQTRVEVHLLDETVWLTQAQMAELFSKDKRTISEHIQNIFKEEELPEKAVVRKFRTTAADGKNYETLHDTF